MQQQWTRRRLDFKLINEGSSKRQSSISSSASTKRLVNDSPPDPHQSLSTGSYTEALAAFHNQASSTGIRVPGIQPA